MAVRRSARGLALACHPGPTVVVTTVATALALSVGRGAATAWVTAAVLAGQLSVGWSNDYLDRHRDAAVGRADKPIVSGDVSAFVVGAAAVVAVAMAVLLSFAGGWRAVVVHAVALAAAWSYNLRLKSTALSPLPYAVAFAALPAFIVVSLPGDPWPPLWMTMTGALLGMGAHFANVLPDISDDITHGIVGLPHRLGRYASTVTAGALLVAATAVLTFAPRGGPGTAGLAALVTVALLAAVLLLPRYATTRTPFRLAMAIAVVNVVLLVVRGQSISG